MVITYLKYYRIFRRIIIGQYGPDENNIFIREKYAYSDKEILIETYLIFEYV
jgi:hypothetical protein